MAREQLHPLAVVPVLLSVSLLLLVRGAGAQEPEEAPGMIMGSVHDSISDGPLPGATVVLLGANRMVETDGAGRFVFPDVAGGTHTLTFFHPRLETLGLGVGGWTLQVPPGDTVSVDFAIPSGARIAETLCGGEPAVLVGFLRDARTGQPVPRGRVVARWGDGRNDAYSTSTDETGRYLLCGLPSGPLRVVGSFVGVEGAEQVVPVGEALTLRDVLVEVATPATVQGRVRSLDTGEPVEGALVRLVGVAEPALTNAAGGFDLGAVGRGMHVLEVQHIAFGVHRETVEVGAGEGLRLEIGVPTRAIELEGIEVTVERRYRGHMAGFEDRMEQGLGSFITREEIERTDMQPLTHVVVSHAKGFRLVCTARGCTVRSSREIQTLESGSRATCVPEIWLDGAYIGGDFDLNQLSPQDVEAIETYDSPATIPPRFRTRNAACGVIVVWTRSGGR